MRSDLRRRWLAVARVAADVAAANDVAYLLPRCVNGLTWRAHPPPPRHHHMTSVHATRHHQ
eukprot:4956427-Pyramimonas_sp.AAC.1